MPPIGLTLTFNRLIPNEEERIAAARQPIPNPFLHDHGVQPSIFQGAFSYQK